MLSMTPLLPKLALAVLFAAALQTPSPHTPSSPAEVHTMSHHATGSFDVKLAPQPLTDTAADKTLSRMSISKSFHGALEATSRGEMLSAMTATKGSAGYVAIEHVTGTLDGHTGGFTLQHTGIMDRGTPSLTISVVPDSGTGELTGLTGTMVIHIAPGGQHSYDFTYSLPQQP